MRLHTHLAACGSRRCLPGQRACLPIAVRLQIVVYVHIWYVRTRVLGEVHWQERCHWWRRLKIVPVPALGRQS